MTFHTFSPPRSFLKKLEEQEDIKDYLKNDADARAFLITGVVIAEGIVFKYSDSKIVGKEATIGVKIPSIAEIGPTAKTGNTTGENIDYEDKGPSVLAFRVQKLKMKDGKLTGAPETEGAYFGDDDEGPNYEVEFDAGLEESDVNGFVPKDVTDEIFGEECILYLPK